MRFQAERAHRLYDEALALLPEADRRAQKPGLMMANIYRTLLREIEADGFQRAAPAHLADAAAQAVDRVAHALARPLSCRMRVAVVGAGWAGLAAAVHARAAGHAGRRSSRWRRSPAAGARTRAARPASRWTTASTS